ncbi:MAG: dTDP-4-dehydrorhamnose 3,5-epimerase [Bacteroidota bacterium]
MAFKKFETELEGVVLLKPDVFGDPRGFFKETYNRGEFAAIGLDLDFLQDNVSYSTQGILRGLHFQAPPYAQGKLVTVLQGEVIDVAVDIRRSSPTYGQHIAVYLSADNHQMLYVPPGFAHGFQVISETCLFCYKCTGLYNRPAEGGLMWNDPALGIDWPVDDPVISNKDKNYGPFATFESPFA